MDLCFFFSFFFSFFFLFVLFCLFCLCDPLFWQLSSSKCFFPSLPPDHQSRNFSTKILYTSMETEQLHSSAAYSPSTKTICVVLVLVVFGSLWLCVVEGGPIVSLEIIIIIVLLLLLYCYCFGDEVGGERGGSGRMGCVEHLWCVLLSTKGGEWTFF